MNRHIAWLLWLGMTIVVAPAQQSALQQPPLRAPTNPPPLSLLLVDPSGARITSKEGWLAQRKRLKAQWEEILGPLPAARPPLKSEFLASEELPGFTRQFVRYQVEEGLYTDGYLLTPAGAKGKLAAVVVFHPTTPFQAKGVAGLAPDYPEEKWQGVQLVQQGYIVWCPRNYIETPGTNWAGNAARVLARHPNWTGLARMVWDAARAADFVESLPNVDRTRIGCLGHSLGGKEVLYAMAFDERYRAGVSSEGGIGLRSSNWDAPWYLGPKIKQPGFRHDNHEVLALIAPRAFLLLAGDSADGEGSWSYISSALHVYGLLEALGNIGWYNHHQGHRYGPDARRTAEQFLDRQLRH